MNGLEKEIYMNSNKSQNPNPQHLFVTGGVGIGKSHLIHTHEMFLEKNFTDYIGLAEKRSFISSNWSVSNKH